MDSPVLYSIPRSIPGHPAVSQGINLAAGHQSCIGQILQRLQNPQLCAGPGESALEIHGIRRLDGSVRAQLNGGSLYKCPCRHDHITVIARHGPRNRGHVAVHRGRRLYALTERNHALRGPKRYGLDDIMPGFHTVRNHGKAKPLIEIGRKYGSF